jgi:exosortase family protein XrtM
VHSGAFRLYLNANAWICAMLLRVMGAEASAQQAVIKSPEFALEIGVGCDALQSIGILAAAILAFPATLRAKLFGLGVGASIQLALNVLRILALYYAGVHLPSAFTPLHHTVLPTFFILVGLLTWLIWARWIGDVKR